jgi:hypothetical protein
VPVSASLSGAILRALRLSLPNDRCLWLQFSSDCFEDEIR